DDKHGSHYGGRHDDRVVAGLDRLDEAPTTPGHANTASTNTAPENSAGRESPSRVTTGIRAFRATWRPVTCNGDSPLASAVLTNGWLITSRIAPRTYRAAPPTPISVSVASGSAKCRSRPTRRLQPVRTAASSPAEPNAGSQCAQYVNAMTSISPSQYP